MDSLHIPSNAVGREHEGERVERIRHCVGETFACLARAPDVELTLNALEPRLAVS